MYTLPTPIIPEDTVEKIQKYLSNSLLKNKPTSEFLSVLDEDFEDAKNDNPESSKFVLDTLNKSVKSLIDQIGRNVFPKIYKPDPDYCSLSISMYTNWPIKFALGRRRDIDVLRIVYSNDSIIPGHLLQGIQQGIIKTCNRVLERETNLFIEKISIYDDGYNKIPVCCLNKKDEKLIRLGDLLKVLPDITDKQLEEISKIIL